MDSKPKHGDVRGLAETLYPKTRVFHVVSNNECVDFFNILSKRGYKMLRDDRDPDPYYG